MSPVLHYKPQLDALRALAVSAVLVHHFLPVQRLMPHVFHLGLLGLLGVLLFFALSGYLITGILLHSREYRFGMALKRFYIRRTLRIFPIYYLTLLVLIRFDFDSVDRFALWHAMYLSNVLYVLNPQAGGPAHLWTLSVEEQFYLVWPFLMLLIPYRHLMRVIIWAVIIGICWKAFIIETLGNHLAGALPVFSCFDSLAVGAWLAFVEQDEKLSAHRKTLLRYALTAGGIVVLLQAASFITGRGGGFVFITVYVGPSLVFTWLVGCAARGFTGRLGTLMEWRPLVYMGKISYGIYLYHYFMPRVVWYVTSVLGLSEPGTLLMFFFATALTLLAAAASWHLIERPIGHLKEGFS